MVNKDDLDLLRAEDDLVCVLRTSNMAQIMVVRSILESAGIPHAVHGDKVLRMMSPLSPVPYCGDTIWSAAVYVRRQDYEEASQLLQENPIEEIDE